MRDTFVLVLFSLFIASGTFLAWTGKVEPQLVLTPIVTGFLGLLASTTARAQKLDTPKPETPVSIDKQLAPAAASDAEKDKA